MKKDAEIEMLQKFNELAVSQLCYYCKLCKELIEVVRLNQERKYVFESDKK